MTAERLLLTTAEAAEALACSPSTVVRLVRSGALRHVNVSLGGRREHIRIRVDDLRAFVDEHTTTGAAS